MFPPFFNVTKCVAWHSAEGNLREIDKLGFGSFPRVNTLFVVSSKFARAIFLTLSVQVCHVLIIHTEQEFKRQIYNNKIA